MFTDRGSVLGKYRLIAEIAHGGMGVVYLAMVQGPGGFNKLVVVKELKPELVEEPTFLTMFLDEARLAARLNHPNIVQTNEVGNDGDRYFMAMEYLDGRGLDHVRRRSKTAGFGLSPSMQLRIISDMLAGLEYAHRLTDFDGSPLNIVHRDISPQNVFLTFSGHVKLLDFGIAKAANSSHETNAGVLKGKVSYMSPEQARGIKADARADVFSAGVMLWEALTGRRLRGGKNEQEKLWALVAADLPRASSVKPWIPPELDEICARAMAWNRDERYQSAGQFQADLEAYLASSSPTVTSRDVGECISELFREDRVRTSALIEAHVAHVRSGALSNEVPIIDVGLRTTVGTPSDRPRTSRPLTASESPEPTSAPSSNLSVAAPSGPRPISLEAPRGRKPVIIAAGAAAATVAVVALLVLRQGTEAPAAAASMVREPPAPQAPPAPPPAPVPAAAVPQTVPRRNLVSVEVRVMPATAKLEIDDAELASNPFAGSYYSDAAIHRVRVSAPGYITKTMAISFDANVKLDLSLEHVTPPPTPSPGRPTRGQATRATPAPPPEPVRSVDPPPAEPAPSEPKPAAKPAATPSEVNPSGGNKPHRPIDPNNPYGG